ncbi:MAG: hypothetical protein BECKG1743D_GA0114223_100483 [Candidatus Kentron sp. G]|nr:MAG: hypothetical protein BECKG1743E_GA0114224_100353 [Candidatus Kentron sp. G]VFM98166.1 MAG: hypothetical protein BECKG1743D_GA0114223_100483 [Candidatus Kentron sp. G]
MRECSGGDTGGDKVRPYDFIVFVVGGEPCIRPYAQKLQLAAQ